MEKTSLKSIYEKIKNVKHIEYFILILAIAIVLSMVGNIFTSSKDKASIKVQDVEPSKLSQEQCIDYNKEERLKDLLSAIKGAGAVEVMIAYKSSKEIVPAMNSTESSTQTEESDNNGGKRITKQLDINSQPVSMSTSQGSQALITKEIEPEIQGVIVVAEGAEDIKVRLELQNAVQTLLGINANQVEVFPMETKRTKE